jgi:hypothetical protein
MHDPASNAVDRVNAFIERALGWMDAHLDEFDPFAAGRPFEIRLGQRVGELSILLNTYLRLTGRRGDPRALRMARLLERIQRHPEFVARLIRSPLEFILFAEVYANLRAVGRDDAEMHTLIQRALDAGFLEQTERFPNRMMDIRACLDMGGFATDYPSLPALYERSILGGRLDPLLLSQEDIYSITHVLMFLYGFGTRSDFAVPEHSLADLERLLAGLLVLVAQEHHWDLMAELLICWECIRLPPTEISEGAWAELEALQDPDGAIPGPEWAARLHAELSDASGVAAENDSYFSHHYHTTLVSLIAGCLRLRRLEAPDLPQPDRPKARVRARSVDVPRGLAAAHAARSWLGRLTDDVLSDADARAGLLGQLLLGQWAAAALAGEPAESVAHEIRRIGERLAVRDRSNRLTWSDASATQLLLVALLLDREEIVVPYLHAPDGFVSRVVEALEATDDPALDELRALLQNAGRLPESLGVGAHEVAASARRLRLSADAAEIDALLVRVEAHTAFGTRPSHLGSEAAWIAELLAAVAVYSLRRYDFIRGGRLIRAVRALEEPQSPAGMNLLEPCVSFVYLNQRTDGAFGFLAPDARALEATDSDRDTERALALPVTVNCLWALAEAETTWRLFESM